MQSQNLSLTACVSILLVAAAAMAAFIYIPSLSEQLPEPGTTIVASELTNPMCLNTGEACDGITIKTEIDVTESTKEKITGNFFIRAYKNNALVGQTQVNKDYNPFAGDGGQPVEEPQTSQELSVDTDLSDLATEFYAQFFNKTPSPSTAGYMLKLKTVGEPSDLANRAVDFYFYNGVLDISFPQ
jgi:hypothetical protein